MLAYKEIIKSIANTEKNFFLVNDNNSTENNKKRIKNRKNIKKNKKPNIIIKKETTVNNKWIMTMLFQMMITKICNESKTIYKIYNELLDSFLIVKSKEETENFKNTFYKIQRVYNILNRIAYMYKFKKTKIVVNTDMCLNELVEGEKNIIAIIQNNSKYLFNVKDLINIIETSLTSSHNFFVKPKKIQNPYNNVAFNKSTLYNIYFFVKFNTNYHSDLLSKFFDCDFNITTFKNTFEHILRDYVIKNFVYRSPANILVDEINYMIEEFNDICETSNISNRININKNFPKDRLIKIMQPYLFFFCKALYSYHPTDKKNFVYYFKQGLLRFSKFNPHFGKLECKLVNKVNEDFTTTIKCETYFNKKHIPFYNTKKQNEIFLTDHLECENVVLNNTEINSYIIRNYSDNNNNNDNDNDNDDNSVS